MRSGPWYNEARLDMTLDNIFPVVVDAYSPHTHVRARTHAHTYTQCTHRAAQSSICMLNDMLFVHRSDLNGGKKIDGKNASSRKFV